jgi:hypothetical protein
MVFLAFGFLIDAFSLREPVSTLLENALEGHEGIMRLCLYMFSTRP